ncbi:cation diffusion facilitator family transporter [Deminuibacter soli]|uniref:Cation transporter n=1 Tax=Deminuibacter soli TaxID=2291815 RepID=A0A3E1NS09_9BACT|nr:cation diffusion facilitator family transporter [Deminuibacter soli]RFM30548.1 cation transporter [Deminuibacter soli]
MATEQTVQHTHSHSHDHGHGHEHGYHHHHGIAGTIPDNTRAFVAGIVLNLVFVVAELIGGFITNSLSLLTDAGHNFSDVATLGLSLLSLRLAKIKPTDKYTFGYRKTTILTALLNTLLLFIGVGVIGWESIQRLLHPPEPVHGGGVAIIAAIGIAVNALSALLFMKSKDSELNAKAAYLHLMADAAVSLGVVVAGVVIYFTNWAWLDTVVSLAIIVILIASSWNLLKESLRLALDGVPVNLSLADIENAVKKVNGVKDIHHIHVWGISTTANALTAHIVVDDNCTPEQQDAMKKQIKHELQHQQIVHATLEFETAKYCCDETME